MSMVANIVRKDTHRLLLALLVWLLLIAGQSALAIGGIKVAADIFKFQMILPTITSLLTFLQGLMIIVLIPLIVQDDAVVGSTAFWLTRPIARKELLAAKTGFVLIVLVALPLLAEVFVLAVNGVTAQHILLAVPEIIIEKTAFLISFFVLAVLTPKLSRYALVGVIVFAVFMLFGVITWVVATFVPALAKILYDYDRYDNASLTQSFEVVQNVYYIVVGLILIAHQYLTRRTVRTIAWAVAAYLVISVAGRFWSIDFLEVTSNAQRQASISDNIRMKIDIGRTLIDDQMHYQPDKPRRKLLNVYTYAGGLPEHQFAKLSNLKEITVAYPDGGTLSSGYVSTRTADSVSHEKFMGPLQAALGDVRIVNPFEGEYSLTEILSLETGTMAAYKAKVGTYTAAAEFEVFEYKVVADLPLIRGARQAFGSQQVVIYDVLERSHGLSVIVGEKSVNLIFDRSVPKKSQYERFNNIYSDFKSVYVIVNPERKEAFLPEAGGDLNFSVSDLFDRPRLSNQGKQFDYAHVNDRNAALPRIDQEWMSGARLVRLDAVRLGSKRVDVKIEDFIIPTASTAAKTENFERTQSLRERDRQREEMDLP